MSIRSFHSDLAAQQIPPSLEQLRRCPRNLLTDDALYWNPWTE